LRRGRLSTRPLVALAAILFAIGIWKGWKSGGPDFRVFWSAARVALEGRADALYSEGPDRYLYAPGFAFLLAPLALLSYPEAHAIWLAVCALSYLLFARLLARRLGDLGAGAVAVATLFLLRPIWIDLRYGQVNLLILAAAFWALSTAVPREGDAPSRGWAKFTSWFLFAIAAFAKLYPLPLFLVPALGIAFAGKGKRAAWAPVFGGAIAGFALLLALPPLFSMFPQGALYSEWMRALLAKGFPLETHNQSIAATLRRLLSGEIVRSHQTGGEPMTIGPRLLPDEGIATVNGIATLAILALLWKWARIHVRSGSPVALGLLCALCFLPSHLVWKPYFLMAVPLAAVVLTSIADDPDPYRRRMLSLGAWALLAASHLSSREVLGAHASAWFEALSGFLLVHLGLIALAVMAGFPLSPRKTVTRTAIRAPRK
jgi:hypothetical protein